MESTTVPTYPAKPPAPYMGGKRKLADRIIRRIEAVPHETYVEPFVGMGGVFLRRPFKAKAEVINDISRDVATLFRVLQRHYVPLMDMLRWQLTSRAEFERLKAAAADTLTDLERAARFLYLQRTAFGGKVTGRNFGVSVATSARFDVGKLGSMLEDIHERLAGVVIECLAFSKLISTYDRPATLFYLDPPYWDCETDYGEGVFGKADFTAMAKQLGAISGKFILSLNDVPEVRHIFRRFNIEAVETGYSLNGKSQSRVGEVLISNL
ncbi:MAG: DNA methyltransferase [Rhodospirillales bacterium 20-58-10]|nr:MAG: DNA methyltransferase [Rhodospirillales bacterium 20-58-10]